MKSFAMSSMPTYLLAPQRHAYVSSRIWLGLRFRILTITFTSSESRCLANRTLIGVCVIQAWRSVRTLHTVMAWILRSNGSALGRMYPP